MGEVENIAPGLSRELLVELPAGDVRDRLQARHDRQRHPERAHRHRRGRAAVRGRGARRRPPTSYQRYVQSQTGALLEQTQEFVDAVKAGDVEEAKALFPVARTYWERIEPVAEIFGDLDPKIDGREEISRGGRGRSPASTASRRTCGRPATSRDVGPYADQLLADVQRDRRELANERDSCPRCSWPTARRSCSTRSPPARSPARRTATRTPTCGTSPPTSRARRPPSRRCARSSRSATPTWSPRSTSAFAEAEAELGQYRAGDGWMLHDQLTEESSRGSATASTP